MQLIDVNRSSIVASARKLAVVIEKIGFPLEVLDHGGVVGGDSVVVENDALERKWAERTC
jgi:formate-dependent phosphoribosylglycinamide formyltransferase (GAR transformylase)